MLRGIQFLQVLQEDVLDDLWLLFLMGFPRRLLLGLLRESFGLLEKRVLLLIPWALVLFCCWGFVLILDRPLVLYLLAMEARFLLLLSLFLGFLGLLELLG